MLGFTGYDEVPRSNCSIRGEAVTVAGKTCASSRRRGRDLSQAVLQRWWLQSLLEAEFLQLNKSVYVVAEDEHPMPSIRTSLSYVARKSTVQRVFDEPEYAFDSASDDDFTRLFAFCAAPT